MRCKSEETMEQIKNAVEEFYFSHYRSPSIGELAAEVGYAKSTVHSYLWEMDRRGLLSYNGNIEIYVPWWCMAACVGIGFATYLLVALMHTRSIRRVSLSEALKVQE